MCYFPRLLPYVEDAVTKDRKILFSPNSSIYKSYKQPYDRDFSFVEFFKLRNDYLSKVVFDTYLKKEFKILDILSIPCGKCASCLKVRSESFGIRCSCQKMWNQQQDINASSYFVTLTFSERYLRQSGSISRRDLQLFFKRLRKRLSVDFKYFACGEYGSSTLRPHYHIVFLFEHYVALDTFKNFLKASWKYGLIDVQDNISDKAMFYTARYCDKKLESSLTNKDYIAKGLYPPFICSSRYLGLDYFKVNMTTILDLGYIQGPDGVRYFIPSSFIRSLSDDEREAYKMFSREKMFDVLNKDVQQASNLDLDYYIYNSNLNDVSFAKKKKLVRIL